MLDADRSFVCQIIKSIIEGKTMKQKHVQIRLHNMTKNSAILMALRGITQVSRDSTENSAKTFLTFSKPLTRFRETKKHLNLKNLGNLIGQLRYKDRGEVDSESKFKLERGFGRRCILVPQTMSPIFNKVCKISLTLKDHIACSDDLVILAENKQRAQNEPKQFKLEIEASRLGMSFSITEVVTVNMDRAGNVNLQGIERCRST